MDWLFDWPDKYPQLARVVFFFWLALVAFAAWKDIQFSGKIRAERKKLIEDFKKKLENGRVG
jgi:hypothetical protein